jgi:geranylgeranyl diphosphate synthase, type II
LEFIKPYAALVEKNLRSLSLPDVPETLYAPQRYILEIGGKRIRPVLALLSCGLCGSKPEKAISAALAVELLHNFTLIHDDIMDQAGSRRGMPSVHIKWNVSSAILSGDGLFVQSMLQLQNLPEGADHKRISEVFLRGINSVCEGQALDMEFENRSDVTLDEYINMIGGKTAALISAAMVMGGMCGCAAARQAEMLDTIGTSLGLAFQIQDDWLDVTADPDKFGKRRAGDIYEGKKTFLMLNALENCSEAGRSRIRELLKLPRLGPEMVDEVISLYSSCGAIDAARTEFLGYYSRAEEALHSFEDSPYKQDLIQLINYLKNREN